MEVEIDETRLGARGYGAGDRADADGAVTAQHERELAGAHRRLDPRRDLTHAAHDRLGIHRARFVVVDAPAELRRVAPVVHLAPGGAQRVHQPGGAQSCGSVLLAGSEGAGARRRADQRNGSAHSSPEGVRFSRSA